MTYRIVYEREAAKALAALSQRDRRAIYVKLEQLAADPYAMSGVKRLQGSSAYRLRVGDYRVVYGLDDGQLVVVVVRVAHRREVYR
jgi:mRNA interferase RelE/StbE